MTEKRYKITRKSYRRNQKRKQRRELREKNINSVVHILDWFSMNFSNIGEVLMDCAMTLAVIATISCLLIFDGTTAGTFTKYAVECFMLKAFFFWTHFVFSTDLKESNCKLVDKDFRPKMIYEKIDQLILKLISYAKDIKSILK